MLTEEGFCFQQKDPAECYFPICFYSFDQQVCKSRALFCASLETKEQCENEKCVWNQFLPTKCQKIPTGALIPNIDEKVRVFNKIMPT